MLRIVKWLTLAAACAAADSVPNLKLNPLPASVLMDPSKISVKKIGTTPTITSWSPRIQVVGLGPQRIA